MAVAEGTSQQQFQEQGYAVIRGLLDFEKDIQPVYLEYAELLDRHANCQRVGGRNRHAKC